MDFIQKKNCNISTKHNLVLNRNEQVLIQRSYPPSALASNYLNYVELYEVMNVTFPWNIELLGMDSYLLLYSNANQGHLTYNSQTYELSEHTYFFIDCKQPFRLETANCSWQFEALYINGKEIQKYYNLYSQDGTPICQDDGSLQIKNLIRKINTKQECSDNIPELLRSQIITDLLTTGIILKYQKMQKYSIVPEYIVAMKAIFDERYSENHTLDSIAKEINYNKFKLAKDFKLYTSYSPIDYLIHKRIEIAKELLVETRLSVSEVGYKVGIENTPHFINLFKKLTGQTPNKYRLCLNRKII